MERERKRGREGDGEGGLDFLASATQPSVVLSSPDMKQKTAYSPLNKAGPDFDLPDTVTQSKRL